MSKPLPSASPRGSSLLLGNWLSIVGLLGACSGFFAALCLVAFDLLSGLQSPYMGVLTYLIAPGFMAAGIFTFLAGVILERRRRHKRSGGQIPKFLRIDFNDPRHRRRLLWVASILFIFLMVSALGSYRTYEFSESVMFCGKTCHAVMEPEYTAYQLSPHARVACVQCHVGPGASWFVRSKLSGAYQVYAVLADKYPRPIPVPIKALRPARETCEQCHWPQAFLGDAMKEFQHHLIDDEKNTPWTAQMLIKIGGGDPRFGPVSGIHWHVNVGNKIEYIASDESRQVIPWVRFTDPSGKVTVYQSADKPLTPPQIAAAQPRTMDCIDCHNRPSHIYTAPTRSVDRAINIGRIDGKIPYIKQQSIVALIQPYATADEAAQKIDAKLTGFYQAKYPDFARANQETLAKTIAAVQDIYRHSFFPHMKVNWRTYPDNIGHMNFPGCFRCHDGQHATSDGRKITRDCNACHLIVAQGRDNKLERDLQGLKFAHPGGESWKDTNCTECHDGALGSTAE